MGRLVLVADFGEDRASWAVYSKVKTPVGALASYRLYISKAVLADRGEGNAKSWIKARYGANSRRPRMAEVRAPFTGTTSAVNSRTSGNGRLMNR